MALFPGPDSPAYRAWSAAADVVILNVLTLAGCLPVVTAGASLTACARVAGEMAADGDPAVITTWWRSFRLNLSQSLTWWLPVLVLVTLGGWEYLVLAGSSPEGQHGTVSGALSGVVLAGGVLLAAVLIWLVALVAFWELPAARAAVAWFMVLIGPAFQVYLIALLQRSTMTVLGAPMPAP